MRSSTGGIAAWTTTQTRRRTGALLRDADPVVAEAQRTERSRAAADVTVTPSPVPGLSDLKATLPAEDAARLHAAIEARAQELKKAAVETDSDVLPADVTIGQCRVQSLIDLILANTSITANLELRIPIKPVRTPQERREATAQLVGITPGMPAHQAVDLAAKALNAVQEDPELSPLDVPDPTFEDWLTWQGLLPPLSLDPLPPPAPPPVPWTEHDDGLDDIDWDACLTDLLDELDGQLPATPATDLGTDPGTDLDTVAERPARPPSNHGITDVLIPGVGVVPASIVRELINTIGTTFTRTLLDNATGTTVHTSTTTYRPTAGIKDFVTTRDQHCRFPGCTARPQLCDLDHVIPWPAGPTTPANLHLLCRHHHRAKHTAGWTIRMTTDGIDTWTSPTGDTHTTRPAESANS